MASNVRLPPIPSLNPGFNKDYAQLAVCREKEAFRYNLLSKITLIAIGLLALATLAVSFTVSGALPVYLLFGAIVTTPFLGAKAQTWKQRSFIAEIKAASSRRIIKETENLKDEELTLLSVENNYNVVLPKEIPTYIYRPLLAIYKVLEQEKKDLTLQINTALEKARETDDRETRLRTCRDVGEWQQKRTHWSFHQAFLLDILENPTEAGKERLLPRGELINSSPDLTAFEKSLGLDSIVYTYKSPISPRLVQISAREFGPIEEDPKALCNLLREKHGLPKIERQPSLSPEQGDEKWVAP